ncbi:MAG: 5-bromo-4-chloroindolyl phosphate hydrolysis family protein [Oscillospiraceae bacterium]|jgi:DNA-binding Lrp family transcriptional regulator|nr:5-bromo-4-chloroindolyl phosphate hydrolysis family protein [Oscillospiraceae bacterium]
MREPRKNGSGAGGDGTGGWIATIVMLLLFWPVGLIMLINRLHTAARTAYVRPPVRAPGKTEGAKDAGERKPGAGEPAPVTASARLEKELRTAKRYSRLLAVAAALALAGGGYTLASSVRELAMGGAWLRDMLTGAFYGVGGAVVLGARGLLPGRARLRRRYLAKLGASRVMRVSEFASALGRSERNVRRELQAMIDDGYFGGGAYIDSRLGALVLNASDVPAAEAGADTAPASAAPRRTELSEYDRVLTELRSLNEKISDPGISRKIERVESASAKIFAAVRENPDKLPQIRRFMSYYLPTALKLLRSYATLERQGIRGENITSAKESIDRVLGTLAAGFERQLDRLFRSDVIDISSDIDVLEGMLARDGLSEASPFRSRTSSGEIV